MTGSKKMSRKGHTAFISFLLIVPIGALPHLSPLPPASTASPKSCPRVILVTTSFSFPLPLVKGIPRPPSVTDIDEDVGVRRERGRTRDGATNCLDELFRVSKQSED